MADDINLGIGFDVSGAEGDESEIEKQIDELDGKSVTVKVDADTKGAEKKIDALSGKSVKVDVLSDPVKPEVVQPEPVRVRAEDPTIRPEVVQPEPVKAEVRVPSPVKPDVKQPDPVTVKVNTPTIHPKVEMPKETSFDALLNIADATGDVDRFQKKLFDLRGSVPIDVIVNCNGALADMRRELASGAPDAEKLQRSNEALAESLRNIGVGNLAKIGTSYTNLTASIKQVSDAVKTGVADAAEETGTRIEASVEGLIGAIEQLDKKAGEYGTVQARQIQGTLAEMRNALKDGADLDSDTLEGLSQWFEKLIEQGNKLPPAGLAKMGKELQKVGSSYADFQKAIDDKNAVEWKIDLQGLDKFDELNRKIEIIQSAKGLDDGIKELQAALGDLDPKNAEKAEKIISDLKKLMTKELNADNLKEMNAELAKFGKLQSGMSSREIAKIGPTLKNVQGSFADLRGKVTPLREEMKGLFDGASFSAAVLSGNIEGVAQGLVGLAAGAGRTKGAFTAMVNSFKVGLLVSGVSAAIGLITSLIGRIKELNMEARRLPIDTASQNVDSTNMALDLKLSLIRRINEETKRGIDITLEQTKAIREAERAQENLAKRRSLAVARTEGERAQIEQAAKENDDRRNYNDRIDDIEAALGANDSDRKALQDELKERIKARARYESQLHAVSEHANAATLNDTSVFGESFDSFLSKVANVLGFEDSVSEIKSYADLQDRINKEMIRNQERIKEIEGTKAGKDGKRTVVGEIELLNRERANIVLRREAIKAQQAVIDSENRIARIQEARRIHAEAYQRQEQLDREEYDRNEQERQYNRRQRRADNGYGANLKDTAQEIDRWAQEESNENRTVMRIRDKYAENMTETDKTVYGDLRRQDAELDATISAAQNENTRTRAIAEQRSVRDRIAELETKYFKEMEEEDRFRLQNALNYRAAARNNWYAAKEEMDDAIRTRRREDEERAHGYTLEDEAFRRESRLKRQGSYGQEAMQTAELARGEREFKEADSKLKAAADGKIVITREEEIKLERQRDESRQRITTARSALDDIRANREERRAEFDANIRSGANRLTAMGLGSGDVSFGRDVATNTKNTFEVIREFLHEFRGQRSTFATRKTSPANTWA